MGHELIIPQPPGALDDVGVFRLAEHVARARGEQGARAIDPQAASGAARGPAGFSLTVYEMSEGTSRLPRGRGYRVVVAAAGALELRGARAGGVTRLDPRDVALVARDDALELRPAGAEARAAVIDYLPPPGWSLAPRPGVARVSRLRPLRTRWPLRLLPAAFHAVVSPRDLYPAVGPIPFGPGRFAVRGPSRLVVVVACTPAGTGPALHIHRQTTEMFMILEGRFRVSWGDAGEREQTLGPLDAIVLPRGVSRAFTAVGPEPGWILPMVVGANDETRDIAWLPDVQAKLREAASTTGAGALLFALARRGVLRFARRPDPPRRP